MQSDRRTQAFTLIELLVGLMVTSIVLSAIATLSFALSSAHMAGNDMARKQAQLRQATVRLSELIAQCRLLCAAPGGDLVLWRADDNGDDQINLNELVYLERGENRNLLRLCQFASVFNPPMTLSDLASTATKPQLVASYSERYTDLVPDCNNVEFAFSPALPVTHAECLIISFTLMEDGTEHPYEIVASLRGRAEYLLNDAGDAIVATDDD